MRRRLLKRSVLGLLILIVVSGLSSIALCNEEPVLFIDPPSFDGTEYASGTSITFHVVVANVTDIKALMFNVSYDSEIFNLEAFNVEFTENLESANMQAFQGYAWFNLSYSVSITTGETIRMVNVTLRVQGVGETSIDLHDTFLWNSSGGFVSHRVVDGYFRNVNPYDLNLDGKVDVLDVAIVGLAFGSYPGHPRWNPVADVDNDGFVTIIDVTLVAEHFGEH